MSILDNLPHVATAKKASVTQDALGGNTLTYATVFTDRACWRQAASDSQIQEFEKRGISVTDRVYFTTDPGIDETHILTDVRNSGATAGTGDTWEVRSRAVPDATAGLGVVWRVMVAQSTAGSTRTE